jgi:RND family efflux transporter MFP subunit
MSIVRWIMLVALIVLAVGAALWYFHVGPFHTVTQEAGVLYHCPMHPQIIRDRPGTCPICGMTLVPFKPVTEGAPPPAPGTTPAAPGPSPTPLPPATSMLSGHSEVYLEPQRVQMIGVRTGRAEKKTLAGEISTIGIVTVDESRLTMIHTKTTGYVDRLLVSRVGDPVRRGQIVAKFYSLELIAAQEDFLAALKNVHALSGVEGADTADIVASARRRLELLGVTKSDIDRIESTKQVQRTIDLVSPVSGVVITRDVLEGHEVGPGTTLMTIGDLSHLWAVLDLYQSDVDRVRPGQKVSLTLPAMPGRVFATTVDYIYPLMDTQTRTAKVRVLLPNSGGKIMPGMYGDARIEVAPREVLTVPFNALLDNGNEQYVFMVSGPGHFMPMAVKVGVRTPDTVEILSGLNAGDEVVTSANFLIDAESRMLAAAQSQTAGVAPPAEHAGHAGH